MDNKSVRIVRLDIDEMDDFSGVDAIALVEEPAIESNFIYFSKQEQNKEIFESYSDYPDSVSNNAKRGIELNEKVNNKCATQVGKVRAQQLAKKEPISVETIKRMYSYLSRAEEYYDESDTEACGTISYLLWGGLSAKRWAESKLKELDLFEGSIDVSGLAPYINEPSGSLVVKLNENDDKEMVDGIVELLVKVEDLENRKQMVIDTIKDFAEQGVVYNLDDFLSRVGVSLSDLDFVDNAGGFSVGDYVSWTFAGRGDDADRGRGQIIDLRVQGEVQVPQTDVTLTATEEDPVALIRTRSGKVVGQYTRNLRQIQKPEGFVTPSAGESEAEFIGRCVPKLREEGYDNDQALAICYSDWRDRFDEEQLQVEKYIEELFDFLGYVDGLPVYSTKEEAMEVAEIAGCGRTYHEHVVGNITLYMPCESHDPEYDDILQEAHDEWMKGRMIDGNSLEDEEIDLIMDYLDSVALDVEFSQDTYASVTGGKQKRNVGNSVSFLDTPTTKIRYRYAENPSAPANRSGTSRKFCRDMMSKRNVVYRKEDINNASLSGVNRSFGPGRGGNPYNLFLYRGGNNCRHIWEEVKFSLQNGKWVDTTMSVGSPTDLINPRENRRPLEGVIGPLGINLSKQDFSEQQVVAGPFMIPDKLIYRFDNEGEYFVYFPKDAIKKIAYKYMEKKYTDSTNLEHDDTDPLKDVFVVESWLISDPKRDKSTIYSNGETYPEGTWYGMMKIKNKEIWDEYVKTGRVRGFSVEGYFIDQLLNKKYQ